MPAGPATVAVAVAAYAVSYSVEVAPNAVTDVNATLGPEVCLQVPEDECSPAFQCVVRTGVGTAGCLPGEVMVGGGCNTAMEGCYCGAWAWVASGGMTGVGTAYVQCCTALPGLDPASAQVRSASSAGSATSVSCEAGEVSLGGGCYSSAGWPVSAVRTPTGVMCTAPGYSNALGAHVLCYTPVGKGPVLTEVSGAGTATCPEGTQLLAGGWAGCPSAASAAYPSGQSFTTSCATAYALCGEGLPPLVCGEAP